MFFLQLRHVRFWGSIFNDYFSVLDLEHSRQTLNVGYEVDELIFNIVKLWNVF